MCEDSIVVAVQKEWELLLWSCNEYLYLLTDSLLGYLCVHMPFLKKVGVQLLITKREY